MPKWIFQKTSGDQQGESQLVKCLVYYSTWGKYESHRPGFSGSLFLWLLFSRSQVVIKKSSNDNFLTQNEDQDKNYGILVQMP